jgi:hypothetical protein
MIVIVIIGSLFMMIYQVEKKTWLVIATLAISVVSIVVVVMIYYTSSFFPHKPSVEGVDLFGIDEIYPTKEGGREWYVDMNNPFADDLFSSTFDRDITDKKMAPGASKDLQYLYPLLL